MGRAFALTLHAQRRHAQRERALQHRHARGEARGGVRATRAAAAAAAGGAEPRKHAQQQRHHGLARGAPHAQQRRERAQRRRAQLRVRGLAQLEPLPQRLRGWR